MDEASLQRVILENPEDDAPRLAYADWLAAINQVDRAEWIRASVESAKVRFPDPAWDAALKRERDAFVRCKPTWWEELKNIRQVNDRGMFRFILGDSKSARSAASIKRLGKIGWLGRAMDDGWLHRIEVWADDELPKVIAMWKEPVSTIPLWVTAAPQIGDEDIRQIMKLPQLQGLDLPSRVLRNEATKQLASCMGLRDLTIELRLVDDATVDTVLDQIATMSMLRRLCLKGHEQLEYGTRPNDADLLRLAGMAELKRLQLLASPAVTDSGIAEFRRVNSVVIISR